MTKNGQSNYFIMKTKKTIFITVSFLLACSTLFSKSYLSNRVLKSDAITFLAYNATKNSLANQSSSLTTNLERNYLE
jgi:hypothetical protein